MRCDVLPLERVYNGTDGVIQYALLDNCSPIVDLSAVNRVVFNIGDSVIDSEIAGPNVIWWTDSIQYRGQTIDVITARLGGQGIVTGEYTDGRLTVYDPDNSLGIVWSDALNIMVI